MAENNSNNNGKKEFNQRNNSANDNSLINVIVNDLQKRITKLEIMAETNQKMPAQGNNVENTPVIDNSQNERIIKEYSDKIQQLKTEKENLISENKGLQEQIKSITGRCEKIIKDKEALEEANMELYSAAYEDRKTSVMNENAFNKTFKDYTGELKDLSIALFSMCGTKKLNETQGRRYVDKTLKKIAGLLAETYGKGNVYRAMGDQFYVVSVNDKSSMSDEVMDKIINALEKDDIHVIYSKAFGDADCENISVLLRDIEKGIKSQSKRTEDKPVSKPVSTVNEEVDKKNSTYEDEDDEIIPSSLTASALSKYHTDEPDKETTQDNWDDELDDEEW